MTLQECDAVIKQQQALIEQLQALTAQHELELRNAETHISQGVNAIALLTTQINDMQRTYSHTASTTSTDKIFSDRDKWVDGTNLLKSKEPTPFLNKASYATWAEGCKTDLCVICPELKSFLEHVESSTFDPLNLDAFSR